MSSANRTDGHSDALSDRAAPLNPVRPPTAQLERGQRWTSLQGSISAFNAAAKVCSGKGAMFLLGLSLPPPKRSFGSIYWTCLSTLATDRAMEAWYDPSMA